MTGRRFWIRALGIWLMLTVAEAFNGTFRRVVLDARLGDVLARQVAVGVDSVVILIVVWATLPEFGLQPPARWWRLGVFWLLLSLAFEIGVGRLVGVSWGRILSDFDLSQGGLLGLGMLVLLIAAPVTARVRRQVQTR